MNRIGLIGENSIEYIDKLLDIWNAGDCAVLIDWRIPFQTAVEMMNEANVSVCYLEDTKYDIKALSSKINFITYKRKSNSAELLPFEIYDKFENSYSRSEAIILYSSGTTGKAKGIILSHYAINTNADAIIDYMKPTKNDCIYIAKVLSHSSTLTGELLVALKTRIKLVIAPTIVPPRFVFRNIGKLGVSIICLNPTLLQKYADEYDSVKYPLPTLKTIYISGSILNDKIYTTAHSIFKNIAIYNVYGLSEAGPRVAAQKSEHCKSNSVGVPITGIEIMIVSDDGKPVEKGEKGVIHVNTPSRFDRYVIGNEKMKSFYRDWLNTGDIGYIDKNDELHIVGRYDDLIIIDSYKIYPNHIEQIALNLGAIKECVVFFSEVFGLTCVYTKKVKENIKSNLMYLLKDNLAYYETPNKYICVDYIPKTPNGKIDSHALKILAIREGEK